MKNQLAEAEARVAKQKASGAGGSGFKMFSGMDSSKEAEEAEKREKLERARASMKGKKQQGPSMTPAEMKQKLAEAEARVAKNKAEGGGRGGGLQIFSGFDGKSIRKEEGGKAMAAKKARIDGARASMRQKQYEKLTPEEMKAKLREAEERLQKEKANGTMGRGLKMFNF